LVESVLVSKPEGLALNEAKLPGNRDAIIAALSHLSEDEIRSIAKDWLKNKFDFEMTARPAEVTLSLPIPRDLLEEPSDERTSLPAVENQRVLQSTLESLGKETSLTVTTTGESLPQVLTPVLESSLAVSDPVKRSGAISQLAILTALWNVDSAVDLIRDGIDQNFPKAKALVHLAASLEAVGNKEKALELLEEAEAVLGESDRRIQAYLPDGSTGNFAQFLDKEISTLKRRLGLPVQGPSEDSLNEQLEGIGVDELPMDIYKSLIEHAVLRGDQRLLARIEKTISMKTDWKGWRASNVFELRTLIGLAEYKFGNADRAREMIEKVVNEEFVTPTPNTHLRAAVALAHVGFPDEALKKIEELQERYPYPEDFTAGGEVYIATGKIKAMSGDMEGARSDFQQALESIAEKRYADEEWRAMNLFEALVDYPDLSDITLQLMPMIRDYEKRADALSKLVVKSYEAGRTEQANEILAAGLRIAENIEDEPKSELMRFRLITLGQRMNDGEKVGRVFDSLFIKGEGFMPEWFSGDPAMVVEKSREKAYEAISKKKAQRIEMLKMTPSTLKRFKAAGGDEAMIVSEAREMTERFLATRKGEAIINSFESLPRETVVQEIITLLRELDHMESLNDVVIDSEKIQGVEKITRGDIYKGLRLRLSKLSETDGYENFRKVLDYRLAKLFESPFMKRFNQDYEMIDTDELGVEGEEDAITMQTMIHRYSKDRPKSDNFLALMDEKGNVRLNSSFASADDKDLVRRNEKYWVVFSYPGLDDAKKNKVILKDLQADLSSVDAGQKEQLNSQFSKLGYIYKFDKEKWPDVAERWIEENTATLSSLELAKRLFVYLDKSVDDTGEKMDLILKGLYGILLTLLNEVKVERWLQNIVIAMYLDKSHVEFEGSDGAFYTRQFVYILSVLIEHGNQAVLPIAMDVLFSSYRNPKDDRDSLHSRIDPLIKAGSRSPLFPMKKALVAKSLTSHADSVFLPENLTVEELSRLMAFLLNDIGGFAVNAFDIPSLIKTEDDEYREAKQLPLPLKIRQIVNKFRLKQPRENTDVQSEVFHTISQAQDKRTAERLLMLFSSHDFVLIKDPVRNYLDAFIVLFKEYQISLLDNPLIFHHVFGNNKEYRGDEIQELFLEALKDETRDDHFELMYILTSEYKNREVQQIIIERFLTTESSLIPASLSFLGQLKDPEYFDQAFPEVFIPISF